MKSRAPQAILWSLLICLIPVYAQSQTKPAKKGAASSVSGQVTIKGKGAPAIVVILRVVESSGPLASRYKAVTDQDGNYRITNVPAGTYDVMPAAPAFVISGELRGRTLIITEGETIEGIDFSLTRGGAITGKVTDSDGRPIIEEKIIILPAETNDPERSSYMSVSRFAQTDDRGVYRIFGLPRGKYKVAAGFSEDSFVTGPRSSRFKRTFYPSVSDPARATIIELTEGGEATNVDITVGRTLDTFSASGRFVDGDTGQPLPNLQYGVEYRADNSSYATSGMASNNRGEFTLENLMPGKYSVFVVPQPNSDMSANTVHFEIVDQNITGLLVKTSKGASVSGVIVFAGTEDKSALAPLSKMELHAYVQRDDRHGGRGQQAFINPDGTFRIGGLQAGLAHFSLALEHGNRFQGLTITRVERDGVPQPAGVEVKEREQVTGIRITVAYGTGTIRGQLKVENGELPPNAHFSVWLTSLEDDPKSQRSVPPAKVDLRGHFLVEGLAGGTYQVNAAFITASRSSGHATKQVTVVDGSVTDVTLTFDLTKSGQGNP